LILKELRLAYFPDNWEHILEFHACARVVTEGYDEIRPPLETRSTRKVIVYLWGEPIPEILGRYDRHEPSGVGGDSTESVNISFDSSRFIGEDALGRRLLLLNELHDAIVGLATRRGWPVRPLEAARSKLIERDLRALWRSKAVSNRSLTMFAHVEGEVDEMSTWFRVVVINADDEIVCASGRQPVEHHGLSEVKLRASTVKWKGASTVSIESRPLPGYREPAYPPFAFEVNV
jgi:hypothetical protein